MTPDQIEKSLTEHELWVGSAVKSIRAFISAEFPNLVQVYKWNAVMWQDKEDLVVGVVPLKSNVKVCFFRTLPVGSTPVELKRQRWGSRHYSDNLVFSSLGQQDLALVKNLLAQII